MSGKSQTIGDFIFCRQSQILPIYRMFAPERSVLDFPDNEFGEKCKVRQTSKLEQKCNSFQQSRGLVMSEIHRRRTPKSPTVRNLSFHLSGMIADYRRTLQLGRVGKIETVTIFQICPRSSQTIGDICDFEFSL